MVMITFLGTGASRGIPVMTCTCHVCRSLDPKDQRLRSSIYLMQQGKSMLIDAGPDVRQQSLRFAVKQLDALLLTHEHRDHTGGLDELQSFARMQAKPIPMYATTRVLAAIQQEYRYLFARKSSPSDIHFVCHAVQDQPFEAVGVPIVPIHVYHQHLPILGFRIGKVAYITDAKVITQKEISKLHGVAVLIVNALQLAPHPAHFSLSETIELAEKVNAQMTYLTHISHRLGTHQSVTKMLPDNVRLAYDGLQIQV